MPGRCHHIFLPRSPSRERRWLLDLGAGRVAPRTRDEEERTVATSRRFPRRERRGIRRGHPAPISPCPAPSRPGPFAVDPDAAGSRAFRDEFHTGRRWWVRDFYRFLGTNRNRLGARRLRERAAASCCEPYGDAKCRMCHTVTKCLEPDVLHSRKHELVPLLLLPRSIDVLWVFRRQ